MKGYWINRCHVTNAEEYGEYAKLAGPAIEKYGGKADDLLDSVEFLNILCRFSEKTSDLAYIVSQIGHLL